MHQRSCLRCLPWFLIGQLAVRDVVHGRQVKNREALANPQALDQFRDLPALRE